jgi:DNA-binding transcriptional LysR family regulator
MELRQLRYFVAVAQEQNFTRAAERLGIKQPPLSAQIRRLESDMGAALFRRSSRGVSLTPAGKLLFDEAQAILEQIEHAKQGVKRRARGETGELRLGFAGGSYFNPVVHAIIRDHRAEYPKVALSPVQTNSAMLTAMVEAGEVDVAFVRSFGRDDEGPVALELLLEEELCVVLPADHGLAGRAPLALAALSKERFLMFPRRLNVAVNERVLAACRRAGFKPEVALEVSDAVSMVALAAAGFGVALVPRSLSQVQVGNVDFLPLSDAPTLPISLAYRRDGAAPSVLVFRNIAREAAQRAGKAARSGTKTRSG